MLRSNSQKMRHRQQEKEASTKYRSHSTGSCSTKLHKNKSSPRHRKLSRSRSRDSTHWRRTSRNHRRSPYHDEQFSNSSLDLKHSSQRHHSSTRYSSRHTRRYSRAHVDSDDRSPRSATAFLSSRRQRSVRERRSLSVPRRNEERNSPPDCNASRTSRHRDVSCEQQLSCKKSPTRSKENSKSPSLGARSTWKSTTREREKSPSCPPKRSARRVWKFDSPPREDGLEEGPQQQSPMGLLAQSLGLSAEQQKASRELYIGNLPPALDVKQLIDFFNAAMLTLKASSIPGNPVSRAWIASDGHFAFVEFRTIEEATIGLQLNGLNCMGYALRIGRPKTYPSEFSTLLGCTSIEGLPGTLPCLASGTVSSASHVSSNPMSAILAAQAAAVNIGFTKRSLITRPDRLVMLDLDSKLCSEEKIKEILTSFGPLSVFQYFEVPETDGRPATAVCVFEYKEHAHQKEMEGRISSHTIGSKPLTYEHADDAIREGKMSEVMTQAAQAGRDLQQELGGELMRPQVPTRVIMLTNIVTREELLDDKEYTDIVEDIFIECSHYGKVISVEIPRPSYINHDPLNPMTTVPDESDIGYAFVKFSRLQGAGSARRRLSGRKFSGRTVEAHYFSEVLFRQKYFKSPQPNYDASGRLLDSPTAEYGDDLEAEDSMKSE